MNLTKPEIHFVTWTSTTTTCNWISCKCQGFCTSKKSIKDMCTCFRFPRILESAVLCMCLKSVCCATMTWFHFCGAPRFQLFSVHNKSLRARHVLLSYIGLFFVLKITDGDCIPFYSKLWLFLGATMRRERSTWSDRWKASFLFICAGLIEWWILFEASSLPSVWCSGTLSRVFWRCD